MILQNRGVFFFDPRHPQYAYNARGAIDFLLFESFRLNSNTSEQWNATQYPDNRYNIAPKVMAEANRPDGFRVLSLGYAAGPGLSTETLTGASSQGYDSLVEDIHVAQELTGFRHYLTDPQVRLVNDFVLRHGVLDDHAPPVWTSTFNDHEAARRRRRRRGSGSRRRRGGRRDHRLVGRRAGHEQRHYVLYAQPQPFDFGRDPSLSGATQHVLTPALPDDYAQGVGAGPFPYQAACPGSHPASSNTWSSAPWTSHRQPTRTTTPPS